MHFPNMLVIANQCRSTGVAPSGDSLRSQSVFQAFPSDEGGSRVPRKRKTDEGLVSPSQSLRDSSPRVVAKGETDCHVGRSSAQ